MSAPSARRRPRRPGPLRAEVRTVLAAAGLPESPTQERHRAHGVVLQEPNEHTVSVEWFPSRSLRRAAAQEQMLALPNGLATRAQEAARRHLHTAVLGVLHEAGYHVQFDEDSQRLLVAAGAPGPALLADNLRRLIAELGGS